MELMLKKFTVSPAARRGRVGQGWLRACTWKTRPLPLRAPICWKMVGMFSPSSPCPSSSEF